MSFQNTQGSNVPGDSYDGQGVQFEQSMSFLEELYSDMPRYLALASTLVEALYDDDSEEVEVNQKEIDYLIESQFQYRARANEFNGKLSEYLAASDSDDANDHLGRSNEKLFKETLRIGFLYYLCDKVLLAVPPKDWKKVGYEVSEDGKKVGYKFIVALSQFKNIVKEEMYNALASYFKGKIDGYYKNNKFVEDCMTIEPKVHSASLFPHDFPLESYRDYDPTDQSEDSQADRSDIRKAAIVSLKNVFSNIKLLDANGQFYPAEIDISYNFVCQFCDAQVPIDQLQQEFKHSDTCRRESETCVDQGINYVDFSRNIIEQIAELPSI